MPSASLSIDRFELSSPYKAHLIGACGSGMKAIAELLLDARWRLTGSDTNSDPLLANKLSERGCPVVIHHQSDLASLQPDLVIYSAAISPDNPERAQAQRLGIPEFSYVQALAKLFNSRSGIAICGTHGKSTTTAILSHILMDSKADPTFVCGAERISDARNGQLGTGEIFIAEACEYNRHFLQLRPQTICLLGIDLDHFDSYPTIEHATEAYQQFVRQLPETGQLIVNSDCRHALEVAAACLANVTTFSTTNQSADWFAHRTEESVTIVRNGDRLFETEFSQPGQHNLSNLLAAIATAQHTGSEIENLTGISTFPGLKRRFEIVSHDETRMVIDDYAHHPTEIRATLSAARERFPSSNIICWFQPHQIKRTETLFEEFCASFDAADEVFVLPVYAARESAAADRAGISQKLASAIAQRGTRAQFAPSLDRLRRRLETTPESNEVLLTLGAGDITRIHNDCTRPIR